MELMKFIFIIQLGYKEDVIFEMNRQLKTLSIDFKEQRIFDLFSRNEISNLDVIADELKVTTRSVRTYIKNLNDSLGEDIVKIIYVRGCGYKLDIKNKDVFEALLKKNNKYRPDFNYKEERIHYLFNYFLNFEGITTIDKLADEINIGRSTLINDFKRVKDIFSSYNLNLVKKQNIGMTLLGNELDKRLFILNYLYKESDKKIENSIYYNKENNYKLDVFKEEVLKIFKSENFYVTESIFKIMINYVLIMLQRIKSKKIICEYDKRFELLLSYREFELAKKIANSIENIFSCKLNEDETLCLTLPLISGNAPGFSAISEQPYVSENIDNLIENIFQRIYIKMGIYIDDDELKSSLGKHLIYTLNRLLFKINLKNLLIDDIKKNYILPYNLAKIASEVIEEIYDLKVTEDEIGYIAIHFSSFFEKNKKINTINKVAIINGIGLGIINLLTVRLKKILGPYAVIKNFSSLDIENIDLSEYDIVFTTVDIDYKNINCVVLRIDPIFDENKIKQQIQNVFYLKNTTNETYIDNYLNSNQFIIQAFIKEEGFMFLQEKNIEKCLNKMIDNLINLGYVHKKFKKDIQNREKDHPTIFDNGLLLPHATNNKSNKLHISVGILEKPLVYNDVQIKIIVLIAFPLNIEENYDLIVKVYEELLGLAQNSELVNQLSQCKNILEFSNSLMKIKG